MCWLRQRPRPYNVRDGRQSRLESLEDRALLNGDDDGSGGGVPLLPDLISWADEARGYLYGWTLDRSGRNTVRLRLSTAMTNIGAGPLELRGSTLHDDGTQDVLQRVYANDGSFVDRLAGEFVFHPSHGHIHFEGFAEYNLRAVLPEGGVGDVVATGGKTSFCLVDLDDYDTPLVGAPAEPQYHGCTNTVVGISVGWADVYEEGLPDQWIDVTNVPAGQYWLEAIADPDNHIEELDETNNISRILIDYAAPGPLPRDVYEPNDSWEAYRDLGTISGSRLIENLTIHAAGNDDYYAFTPNTNGVMNIEARFDNSAGDVNLFVYAGPLHEVAYSVGTTNVERVALNVDAGSLYGIRVIGASGDTSPNYALSFSLGDDGGQGAVLDAHEPNNSRAQSTTLPSEDLILDDLNIHSAVDEDHFRWIAPATGPLLIAADFVNADGNVDLFVYNIAGNLVAASASAEDGEVAALDAYAGQIYFIKVEGRGLETNPRYRLRVDGPEHVLGDTDFDNDVDLDDLSNVRNNFGFVGHGAPGDADVDGDVDINDLNAVRNHFGEIPSTSVPPPVGPKPLSNSSERRAQLHTEFRKLTVDLLFSLDARIFEFPRTRTSRIIHPQKDSVR